MRPGRWIFVALLAAAGLVRPVPPILAQGITGTRIGVNPYVGAFIFDDGELQEIGREANVVPMLGARFNVGVSRRWQFDIAYGYAQVETELSEFVDFPDPEDQIELDVHSIYAAADYFIGGTQDIPTRLLLSAGLGFMIVNPEVGDGDTNLYPARRGFTHPSTTGSCSVARCMTTSSSAPEPTRRTSSPLPGRRGAESLRVLWRSRVLGLAARSVNGVVP